MSDKRNPRELEIIIMAGHIGRMAEELAKQGWIVRHTVIVGYEQPVHRNFACGFDAGKEAEIAVRAYPGVVLEDRVIAVRRLPDSEIKSLKLMPGEIRQV